MSKVRSSDGTPIGFSRDGDGPPVILVGGAFMDRSQLSELAALLAKRFTVFNFDRRGRGESGDTAPYAVAREIEDLDALIGEAGGRACVFGASSGAALALEAAAAGLAVERLVVYEPPYVIEGSRPAIGADIAARLDGLIAAGRPGDAAALFMTEGALVPSEAVGAMRESPFWAETEAMAGTLPYDALVMGPGSEVPAGRLAAVEAPALVLDGGASPAWIRDAARAVAAALPDAKRTTLRGQSHNVAQDVLAPAVGRFIESTLTSNYII